MKKGTLFTMCLAFVAALLAGFFELKLSEIAYCILILAINDIGQFLYYKCKK